MRMPRLVAGDFRYRIISIISLMGLSSIFIPTQVAHSESYIFVNASLDSTFAKEGVYEYYGVIFQEKNGSLTRAITSRPTDGNFKFTIPVSDDPWMLGLSLLEPGAEKTNEASQGLYSLKDNAGVTSLRTPQPFKIEKDLAISVKIPVSQKKISLRVVDASGNLSANSFSQASLTGKYYFSQSGLNWELESSVLANGENTMSSDGTFRYFFYEGTSFSLSVSDKSRSSIIATPRSIKVSNDVDFMICLPINFPIGVRSLSPECLQVQMENELKALADKALADKALADKALADKALADKAAADKAAADASAAVTKKTAITCVKGKLTKKVTALKPRCPKGYMVKK